MNQLQKPYFEPVMMPDFQILINLKRGVDYDLTEIENKALTNDFDEEWAKHITIIDERNAERILCQLKTYPVDTQIEIYEQIVELMNKLSWKFKPKELYHISKADNFGSEKCFFEFRESIIRAIDMPDMGTFYTILRDILLIDMPTPFPHISLFSKGEGVWPSYFGIPIYSEEEFEGMNPVKF